MGWILYAFATAPPPPNTKYLYIESSFLVPQNVTAFGVWVFKEVCVCQVISAMSDSLRPYGL